MTKFSRAELSRDQFLTWIGGDLRIGFDNPSLSDPHAREEGLVVLLFDKSETGEEVQPLIAVPAGGLRDFFAFVGTYATTFRPFSAFFRVIPAEMIPALQERRRPVRDVVRRVAKVAAGSALSEVFLRTNGRAATSKAQLAAVTATLSASLGQAVVVGYPTTTLDWLGNEWSAIHRTNPAIEGIGSDQIVSFWKLISYAARDSRLAAPEPARGRSEQAISQFLANAIHGRGVDNTLLLSLSSSMPVEVDPAKILMSSREDRIRAFNDFVVGLSSSRLEPLASQFIAGLLLAITGNGSFDLLRSGRELLNRSPMSLIWFGVCAALFEESNVLTVANCAGRRLLRDLQRPQGLFDPPRSDLNSFEYRMFTRERGALEQINSQSVDGLEVELLANVSTCASKYGSRDAQLADDVEVLTESLQQIKSVIERAQRKLRYAATPRQVDMFRSDPKLRGRPR